MLSLASCTFGWSKGLIPSTQPDTAVANSAKKKIRPRSAGPSAVSVNVGWPAFASSAMSPAKPASGDSFCWMWTKTRSSP